MIADKYTKTMPIIHALQKDKMHVTIINNILKLENIFCIFKVNLDVCIISIQLMLL